LERAFALVEAADHPFIFFSLDYFFHFLELEKKLSHDILRCKNFSVPEGIEQAFALVEADHTFIFFSLNIFFHFLELIKIKIIKE